ncbi:MAG: hypothetical protein LBQ35_03445, partial [Spirochaetaceae bacterium]|nr:hypothetical protein [Spirochaetaceae bacterium]
FSDINILIILERNDTRKIFEAGKRTAALGRKHGITPLIMTREEFLSASDVFPLEYQDILEAHRVLFGNSGLEGLSLDSSHLRLQMEEKLRGALGDIRRMLIAAGGNEKTLGRLLSAWSGVGNTLFRGLLRLRGIEAPRQTGELLDRVEREYGVGAGDFSRLNDFRNLSPAGSGEKPLELAASLLDSLSRLADAVNSMPAEGV